jgi:hypothetical protein
MTINKLHLTVNVTLTTANHVRSLANIWQIEIDLQAVLKARSRYEIHLVFIG